MAAGLLAPTICLNTGQQERVFLLDQIKCQCKPASWFQWWPARSLQGAYRQIMKATNFPHCIQKYHVFEHGDSTLLPECKRSLLVPFCTSYNWGCYWGSWSGVTCGPQGSTYPWKATNSGIYLGCINTWAAFSWLPSSFLCKSEYLLG